MRITVYDVLSYLAAGMTVEEVLVDFPYLTREDILACLAYAADRERSTLVSDMAARRELYHGANRILVADALRGRA
jgi:hypothetical protein